ncbi:hypothetical protein SprV_0602197900 [Sparganum proliferum]
MPPDCSSRSRHLALSRRLKETGAPNARSSLSVSLVYLQVHLHSATPTLSLSTSPELRLISRHHRNVDARVCDVCAGPGEWYSDLDETLDGSASPPY